MEQTAICNKNATNMSEYATPAICMWAQEDQNIRMVELEEQGVEIIEANPPISMVEW